MVRIGVTLNEHDGPDALTRLTDDLRRANDDGFASAWMSHIFGMDALTALAVAAGRVPDIEVGTAVVPTFPRHPAALAQQARTAALAAGPGRLTLGIGLSHRVFVEDLFGYSFARPLRHMDEYLSVLLPLLEGHPTSFSGETVQAQIRLTTPGEGRVPVLLGALGPRMLKLAAERTEGTVLWMSGSATVRDHVVPTITAAAQAAGRPTPRVVCMLPVGVTNDPESAYARATMAFRTYGSLPSYRAMIDREGVAGPADLAVIGDEDAVGTKLGELAKAGITDFVALEFLTGADAVRTRTFLGSLTT
ncbi:LLM class F420-dependent oxidoreductase [Streptomyces sp. NPDC056669]|uniref:LLM class F420-dependent oxidoreductase n=1 Tax=Streptomyces sp. NPDC056669 TaxID=3345903 RepID=UPI00367FDD0B